MVILGSLAKRIPFLYISKNLQGNGFFPYKSFYEKSRGLQIWSENQSKTRKPIDFRDCDYTGKIE